jgi:hypothetical protein
MKKFIHVNQQVIRHNNKYGNSLPACRVQQGTKVRYCSEVIINGTSQMVYRPETPLPCGAKLWIETEADIVLVKEVPYKRIAGRMKKLVKDSK